MDGIFAVEPEVAKGAPLITTMTHDEATELTLGGKFGILQYGATVPLSQYQIVTNVLNTFNDESQGTFILPQKGREGNSVTGIVYRGDNVAFEINKPGIANLVGFMEGLTGLFRKMGISIEYPISTTTIITVVVKKESIEKAGLKDQGQVVQRLREEIKPKDILTQDLGVVAVVGEGLSWAKDAQSRIQRAIENAGISRPMSQHAGITTTLWTAGGQGLEAAKAIYNEFFSNGEKK